MQQSTLFAEKPVTREERLEELQHYPTPCWVAEALIEEFFPDLDRDDMVIEPSCAEGRFLQALPAHVPALGVELDEQLAQRAREITGRRVLTGDFRTVEIDVQPSAIIGNPPFETDLLDDFLARAHRLLPDGGRVGFILSSHMLQTAKRVARYNDDWGIAQTMLPRNIYHGLIRPLVFAVFSKDQRKMLVGFSLYRETADLQKLPTDLRDVLTNGRGSVWKIAVERALRDLGGQASIDAIYATVVGNRPTSTPYWREKVRQTLARYRFRHVGPSYWALPEAA